MFVSGIVCCLLLASFLFCVSAAVCLCVSWSSGGFTPTGTVSDSIAEQLFLKCGSVVLSHL